MYKVSNRLLFVFADLTPDSLLDDFITANFGTRAPRARAPWSRILATPLDSIVVKSLPSSDDKRKEYAGSNPGSSKVIGRDGICKKIHHLQYVLCLCMRAFVTYSLSLLICDIAVNQALSSLSVTEAPGLY